MVSDMMIFPVSISYERTLEEDLFARELMGVPKPKETLSVSTCKFMAFTIYQTNKQTNKQINWHAVEHRYNEFFYNEFMVITNQSLHPVVISVLHCSSFITKLRL